MKKIIIIILTGLISFSDISSQTSMPLPPEVSSFCCSTRGYWFTVPTDMVITSLRVPTSISTAPQSIALVRFDGNVPPPAFPGTTLGYTTLHLTQGLNSTDAVNVNIPVSAGDVIGLYGSRGGNNSYGPEGPFNTTLLGFPVTLTRSGMQANIESTYPFPIWEEAGFNVARVEMTVRQGNVIPTMSQWGLFILLLSLSAIAIVSIRAYSKLEIS